MQEVGAGGGGGGGEGLQQTMCGNKNYLWNQNAWVLMQSGPQQAMCPGSKNESKCVGADAVRSGRAKSGNDYEKRVHAGQRRACMGHLAKSSRPHTVSAV